MGMTGSWSALDPAVKAAFFASSLRHRVPVDWLLAVGWVETRWRHLEGDGGKAHTIMQINERWHPRFDNEDYSGGINYAAGLLRDAYERRGSWGAAVTEYNSGDACYEGGRPTACARGVAYRGLVEAARVRVVLLDGIDSGYLGGSSGAGGPGSSAGSGLLAALGRSKALSLLGAALALMAGLGVAAALWPRRGEH